jgi:hypothetical protein
MADNYFDAKSLFGTTPEELQREIFDASQQRRDEQLRFMAKNTLTPAYSYAMGQALEPLRQAFMKTDDDPRVTRLKQQVEAAKGAFQGFDKDSETYFLDVGNRFLGMGMIPQATKMFELAKAKREAVGKKKHPYITAGKNIFNTETGEFQELPKEIGNRKVKWVDTVDNQGKPVTRAIDENNMEVLAELPAQPETGLSATMEKEVRDSSDSASKYRGNVSRINASIAELEGLPDFGAGAAASAAQIFKDNLGLRNKVSAAKRNIAALKVDEAIGRLPTGPASDKDIALVMGTVPPDNASKAELLEWLGAYQRTAQRLQRYYEERADWVGKNSDLRGFDKYYRDNFGEARTPEPTIELPAPTGNIDYNSL